MKSDSENICRYGAYAIIIQDNKLLLTQKKSGPFKGLWDLPGGAIEFGETPEIAVKREVLEETAFEASKVELLTVLAYHGSFFTDRNEIKIHHIGIIYRVDNIFLLSNRIPEEQVRWLPISEIDSEELTPFAKQSWTNKFFYEKN